MQLTSQTNQVDVSVVLAEHFAAIRACIKHQTDKELVIARLSSLEDRVHSHISCPLNVASAQA